MDETEHETRAHGVRAWRVNKSLEERVRLLETRVAALEELLLTLSQQQE